MPTSERGLRGIGKAHQPVKTVLESPCQEPEWQIRASFPQCGPLEAPLPWKALKVPREIQCQGKISMFGF